MRKRNFPEMRGLEDFECLHYRDQFRSARYAALADAEAFNGICFVLESLGLRLLGQKGDMGLYEERISVYALKSAIFNSLAKKTGSNFKTFDALYRTVRTARNDAMHTGAYARHATEAAIELCIGLEEGLMVEVKQTVGDLMVKSPIVIESWQPVAHARQLMLMHSFSFLPVRIDKKWWLVSEVGLAKFLNKSNATKRELLGQTVEQAKEGLELIPVSETELLLTTHTIESVLDKAQVKNGPTLWIVLEHGREDYLAGVLSPFELM